jgi:hypothetical protein
MENFPFIISHFSFFIAELRLRFGLLSCFLPPAPAACSCRLPLTDYVLLGTLAIPAARLSVNNSDRDTDSVGGTLAAAFMEKTSVGRCVADSLHLSHRHARLAAIILIQLQSNLSGGSGNFCARCGVCSFLACFRRERIRGKAFYVARLHRHHCCQSRIFRRW